MTPDELIEQVDKLKEDRRKKPRKEVEFCDLCGISDSHLHTGLCAWCRSKYKLEPEK